MKNKISGKIAIFLLTLIIVVTFGIPLYAKETGDKANSFRYKNGQPITKAVPFSTLSPNAWKKIDGKYYSSDGSVIEGAIAKGIDVSYHQGTVDWKKVKADGVEFAIIRCGLGMDQTNQDDTQWLNNVKGCEENNIPYGVYLYSYADTVAKAQSEAEHVLRLIKGHTLQYPVYYDIEDKSVLDKVSTEQLGKIAETFVNKIKTAGYQVGVYSNKYNFETYLTAKVFDQWNKWIAQYKSPSCTYNKKYQIWQATDTGTVDGIDGAVDIDFIMKTTQSPSNNNSGTTNTTKPGSSTAAKPSTTTAAKKNTTPVPVNLRKPTIQVKSPSKKKAQISWNLRGNGVKYQIFYSTKKNKGYKKVTTVSSSKKKVIIKNKCKSKKKYYFKVRCLKTVKGKTYYSAYSAIKSVKVK